jgi:hypothetical protein
MSFKLRFKIKFLLLFIFLVLVNRNYSSLAQAKPNQSSKITPEAQQNDSSKFKLPARGSPIGRRRGGTSRNNCPPLNSPLTALVPGEEPLTELVQSNSYLASTVSKNPTFWFYIPKLPVQMQTGEFFMETEAGEVLKRTQIKLPSTEGTFAITLPSSSKYSLAIGKKYHWYFKIYCGESTPESDYYFVDAWIERIPVLPELKTQLQITNQADYLIYRDRHIWYDAVTSLGQKLQINPNDNQLKTDWVNLLKSVNLSYLGNLPIIGIYQLK